VKAAGDDRILQAKASSRVPSIRFDVRMTLAPASASKRDRLDSSRGLSMFSLAGFAICCASRFNCWLLVAIAVSPLSSALGQLTGGRGPRIGLIGGISAGRGQSLEFIDLRDCLRLADLTPFIRKRA
jgi:hypothetical protein